MCSARRLGLAAIALLVLAAAGCQFHKDGGSKADLNTTPLVIDDAMQKRDWERSTAQYANGDTVSGAHLIIFESKEPEAIQRVTDPAIAAINDSLFPVTMILVAPWKDVNYPGVQTPPTYTAQPASRVIP